MQGMTEHEIQNAIKESLEWQGYYVGRCNSGKICNSLTGTWVQLFPTGHADLITHDIKTNAIIFLEVKTPTGALSVEQIQFLREQHKRGRRWAVVTSVIEAEQAVRDASYHGQPEFAAKVLDESQRFIPTQVKKTKKQRMSMTTAREFSAWSDKYGKR